MDKAPRRGWFKHADFIILDILCLQLSFLLAYFLLYGIRNPYERITFEHLAETFFVGQILSIAVSNKYNGIIRRGTWKEFTETVKFAVSIIIFSLVILFVIQNTQEVSRLQFGWTMVLFISLDYCVRMWNKRRLQRKKIKRKDKKSMILMTSGRLVDEVMATIKDPERFREYTISEIVLTDDKVDLIKKDYKVPIEFLTESALEEISGNWVDEIFFYIPDDYLVNKELINDLIDMGITVHLCPELINDSNWTAIRSTNFGRYHVITGSMNFVSEGKLFWKRVMDIAGGLIGCFFTLILMILITPIIKIQSPGPIFFKQERVGLNGRIFQMYKFRSMYMDAEERLASLMKDNRIENGLMTKIENDPRIIGSGKDGTKKGIGYYLRRTSIDEFPQFFNVLKGEMSIVGTRPPLISEWEKYSLHHRARMTVKPGITGVWQTSGRSDITDFEEVVRMDKDYIEHWSLLTDVKIILKTIAVIFTHDGAK